MNTADIYQYVTDTIIELLETHIDEDYQKPWISMGQDNDYARNPSSTNPRYYRGINQFLLSIQMMQKGYLKNTWMTFNQIKKEAEGAHVKKGEKSTPIIFYKTAWIDRNGFYYSPDLVKKMPLNESQALGVQSIPVLKMYRVFNIVAQTEGLPDHYYEIKPQGELQDFEKDEAAENLIKATGAHIEIREGNAAYYDRASDKIVLPLREQFKGSTERFYSVALHETVHWSGGPNRLNRTFGTQFADTAYGEEELVAELGAAFLCAHLGFSKTITQNAAYIKSWLGILKQNSKAIVKASSEAQKAADYIIGGPEYYGYNNDA